MIKKITFALLLMFISTTSVLSQDSTEIDFTCLQKEYEFNVPHKKHLRIHIKNINKNIYKIEDEKTEQNFNTTLPDALKSIKLPGFLFNLPVTSKTVNDEIKKSPFVRETDGAMQGSAEVIIPALFKEIEVRAKKINLSMLYYNKVKNLSKDCKALQDEIKKSLITETNAFLYADKQTVVDTSRLAAILNDTLTSQRPNAEAALQLLTGYIPIYIAEEKKSIADDQTVFKRMLSEAEEDLTDPKANKQEKTEAANAKKTAYDSLTLIKERLDLFNETAENLKAQLEKAKDVVNEMFEIEKDNKLFDIVNSVKTLLNPATFIYKSDIIIPKKDETTIVFTITPNELTACGLQDKISTEVKLRTVGGVKIDVSTGAFVNGGSEDFLGNTYYYETLNGDTRQIISAKRKNRLMLSVGALVHISYRSTSFFKVGGSVGVSTTAGFDELNFHAGPSIILGNKNRLIISGGLTLKSAKVLDRQLEMNKSYKITETPDDIPTVTIFPKAGWFLGLSYNLSIFN